MPHQNNSVDFSKYIAVGDSVTAGYADGALFYEGQIHCYPNLIAKQISLSHAIEFKQALTGEDSVGVGFYGNSRLVLKEAINKGGLMFQYLDYVAPHGDLRLFAKNEFEEKGPFNNMAVPGLRVTTLLAPGYGNPQHGEGNYNPFFTRMASNLSEASVLSDIINAEPTFFSLFIGNNDVLAYAINGGIGAENEITPIDGYPGVGFESSIKTIINALTANGAKGVVTNIADITSIPFFTTISYNDLIVDADNITYLNQVYANYGIIFTEGKNAFVVEAYLEENITRQLQKGELLLQDILLDPLKDEYLQGLRPIPKKYVLLQHQVELIQNSIDNYNTIIEHEAKLKQLAFVDLKSVMTHIETDRFYNYKTRSINYKTKNVFSLDGIHINASGQTLLANAFIKAINTTYQSVIPYI